MRAVGSFEVGIQGNVITCVGTVQLVAALVGVVCAALLVRRGSLSWRALRTVVVVDVTRMVVVSVGLLEYYYLMGYPVWWNVADAGMRPENTLPLSAVLLWYWWPAIRGRANVDGRKNWNSHQHQPC